MRRDSVAALAELTLPWYLGGPDWPVLGYALYIVLPAVVLSAIGTAIGMHRARRAGKPPPHGPLAT